MRTINDAFNEVTASIKSGDIGQIGKSFAGLIFYSPVVEAGKAAAPVITDTFSKAGLAIENAGEKILDVAAAPVKAAGKFLDSTVTKLIIGAAVVIVGVIVVKKVMD